MLKAISWSDINDDRVQRPVEGDSTRRTKSFFFFFCHTLLLPTVVQRVKYRNNAFESYVQTPLGTKSTEWAQDASANERTLLLMFKRA